MPTRLGRLVLPLLVALVGLQGCQSVPAKPPTATSTCDFAVAVSTAERQLYQLLNRYRNSKGLPAVPLSLSLAHVARSHARDLRVAKPQGACSLHSWSRRGGWTACCYTLDHLLKECMWHKPRELTPYPGNGYEIAAFYEGAKRDGIAPQLALHILQDSYEHNRVILNQGPWVSHPWASAGVGMSGSYAVAWFGEEHDPCGYF